MQYKEWLFEDLDLWRLVNAVKDGKVLLDTGYPLILRAAKQTCAPVPKYREPMPEHGESSKYQIRTGWEMPRAAFVKAVLQVQEKMTRARAQWDAMPDIVKVAEIVRYSFNRNLAAHRTDHSHKYQSFEKKSRALEHAVYYARLVHLPLFLWGYSEDAGSHHPTILYFQFREWQVSFHSDFNPEREGIPEFSGSWNGIRQVKFPFTNRELLAACKGLILESHPWRSGDVLDRTMVERYLDWREAQHANPRQHYQKWPQTPVAKTPETKELISLTLDNWMNRKEAI